MVTYTREPARDSSLDGLRGIAILMVIAAHLGSPVLPHGIFRGVFGWVGALGVDLFFVISGFLITNILVQAKGRDDYFGTFYVRRAQRILPLYAVFILLSALFVAAGYIPNDGLWTYPFFVQNIRPFLGLPFNWPVNVSWSLCVEEHFYLAWPLLVACCDRRRLLAVCVAMIAVSFTTRAIFLGEIEYIRLTTPARLDGLAMGAALALGVRPSLRWFIIGVVATVALKFGVDGKLAAASDKTLMSLAFMALVFNRGVFARALSWAPLAFVGRRCFGLYLLHPLALVAVGLAAPPAQWWVYVPLSLAVTFLAAEITWRCVEEPVLRLGRKGRPSAITPAAA